MIGQMLEGRYRIDAPIARGGMSMVFRGVDTRLDRPVAIKVMDPKFAGDPQFLSRFEFEARAVAKLKHPSLVAVYDQGVDGEHPFLIMELVEGGTLRELLRERGPMPPHAVYAVAEPVLAAIGVAHKAGLVHRDVKPENVLISDSGEVKIADFGLVRAVAAANTTSASVILGTAAYLSPEQVTSGTADSRSDVYAFGVLIFELLTGQVPFTGDNSLSVAYQRIENDVPSPSELIAGVPPEFDRLVARATAREPSHRFADANEMAAELRSIASTLDLPAYRVPAPQESAEHLSASFRAAPQAGTRQAGPAPQAQQPQPTRVVTTAAPRTEYHAAPEYIPPPPPRHHPQGPHSPYADDRARSRRTALLWIAIVAVLTLLVGIGGWWLGVGRYSSVPPIAGLDTDTAAAELSAAGFETDIRQKASDTIPVGNVVGSDPGAGARVTKGSTVSILVSSGKPRVPDLSPGDDLDKVDQLIRDQGLLPVDSGEVGSPAPEGTLARVEPAPGTVLPMGAQVKVYTSNGAKPVRLPDLRAKTEQEARKALDRLGITVAGTRPQFDPSVEAGRVIGTDPAAGTTVDSGSPVTLVICEAITMPEVLGQSVAEARRTLEALGLQVKVRQLAPLDSSVVVSQTPAVNANVEEGSTVTIVALP
ncbi:Stk1 family PASTA domain-containing Ser/Thr kinase [Nocardia donostiensis]|uniref:non-specific serine/threonine protein kinase n=1 Tax=Nocardia donostiensis TaxID=1538463 RepID=A0A1V2T925_9NOCA|nr:Stk1 family PASTA domain-containing Ser/Thr kinase [Nocardia donostiensis]ONM46004.1 serine/threonine protein kinase [Nocardia donostiensis]OQS12384.1 serine/threonine protein kinase [Nocardia donostiensis]OQS18495.1 serine/threonine protein kinase [Nocardia donostiensis]